MFFNKKYTPVYIIILIFIASLSLTIVIGNVTSKNDVPTASVQSVASKAAESTTNTSKVQSVTSLTPVAEDTDTDITATTSTQSIADDQQPDELTSLLSTAESSYSKLGGTQLVTVETNGAMADVTCWEKQNTGEWKQIKNYSGFVGYWGLSESVTQNDSYTPKGLFNIGTGFGVDENFDTALEYFKVTSSSCWITDDTSKYYNKHMDSTADKDWDDAIAMSDESAYKYGASIDYSGSAAGIFLCCGTECSQHDVVVPEENMKEILSWLSKNAKPQILIF